ncbi:MAG: hypothetical protein ACK5RH_03440, partial [Burkholderiales bacterium]
WPLGPAFVTPIAVFLLHPFGDLSKTEKTSLHHSFTAVSGGGNCRKEDNSDTVLVAHFLPLTISTCFVLRYSLSVLL